jgi:N6-L-threonylcarbamoyladenine synthase
MSVILGIETSCDETAVAVVTNQIEVKSNIIYTQTVHADYGGVVPELASREHLSRLHPLFTDALAQAGIDKKDIDGIAVTRGPGLIGCLLVGVAYAKGLSASLEVPFIGVNHLEGHAISNRLVAPDFGFPHVTLIVSGGHTSLVKVESWETFITLGQTRDDAAGEALDKIGKLVGLPYPAGAAIDKLAQDGNPTAIKFPRARLEEGSLDFSFSGVKTSAAIYLEKHPEVAQPEALPDFFASFQAAIVDVLVEKLMLAAKIHHACGVALSGGVACNSMLRNKTEHAAKDAGLAYSSPPLEYCTDNAAMIAARGAIELDAGRSSPMDLVAVPTWAVGKEV